MIVIVGAGMGGLAAGLGLLRNGYKVKILEAAPYLGEVGAGISLSPNAVLALNYLGLQEFLRKTADRPKHTAVIHYKTGELLSKSVFGDEFEEKFGAPYLQIHRADLQAGLIAAVRDIDPNCIELGHAVAEISKLDDGAVVACANGQQLTGKIVIGCDGLRSVVREALFGATEPRWTGQVAYRATLPAAPIRTHLQAAPTAVTVGPSHIVTRYLIRHGTEVNVVAIARSNAWKQEGWSHPATIEEVLEEHRGWNDDIRAILSSVPESQLFKWALYGREPLTSWVCGHVSLLGDAAHPMLPFLGMGAAMAFEDAVVLARCVEAYEETQDALMHYAAVRIERANATLLASRRQGEMLQASDPLSERWSEQEPDENREWVRYGYNAATVAV